MKKVLRYFQVEYANEIIQDNKEWEYQEEQRKLLE